MCHAYKPRSAIIGVGALVALVAVVAAMVRRRARASRDEEAVKPRAAGEGVTRSRPARPVAKR